MGVVGWLSVLIVWAVVSSLGLILSLLYTNPSGLGPLGVTLWFVTVFLCLSAVFALGLYVAKSFMRVHATNLARLRYAWRQGMLMGGWVTGVLALGSLRQLSVLDAILLALLLLIVEVYVRLRWP